jgi:hypothetical protein
MIKNLPYLSFFASIAFLFAGTRKIQKKDLKPLLKKDKIAIDWKQKSNNIKKEP